MADKALRILALEPYYGGSHRSILDALARLSRHCFTLLTMPARKWKWRMRGSALEFADRMRALDAAAFDLVFTCDMTSVADLKSLAPRVFAGLPIVTYFHENQLSYPLPDEADRDYQYGFTNVTTCLASDAVWFNSAYHRGEFLAAVAALLRKMPDCVPEGLCERIAARSRVMHPGVEVGVPENRPRERPFTVLWNQRWEWDKNPEQFFAALREVRRRGARFRLAVAGETFRVHPAVFNAARCEFGDVVDAYGYLPRREDYEALLARADVVVSTARHEFFGLSAVEAAAAGAVPLVPRRLSYPEVFDAGAHPWAFYEEGGLADRLEGLLLSQNLPPRSAARGLVSGYLWENRIREWDSALAEVAASDGSGVS